jgi:hypothetical protein
MGTGAFQPGKGSANMVVQNIGRQDVEQRGSCGRFFPLSPSFGERLRRRLIDVQERASALRSGGDSILQFPART